jgi:hypothetical protein
MRKKHNNKEEQQYRSSKNSKMFFGHLQPIPLKNKEKVTENS